MLAILCCPFILGHIPHTSAISLSSLCLDLNLLTRDSFSLSPFLYRFFSCSLYATRGFIQLAIDCRSIRAPFPLRRTPALYGSTYHKRRRVLFTGTAVLRSFREHTSLKLNSLSCCRSLRTLQRMAYLRGIAS